MHHINLIYEDDLSEAVMTKLLMCCDDEFLIHNTYSGHGFGYLKSNIKGFNQASNVLPHFMLTDLDNFECPPQLINEWIDFPVHPKFIFRIAVREVEAWLLADVEGLSNFFKVSSAIFPQQPENEDDPKGKLIQIAKRSRIRSIREDIVPINENAAIGPNYNGRLTEFVYNIWNIKLAMERSKSLKRTFLKLESLKNAE